MMVEVSMKARPDLVVEARSWIGTPYQHQASCKSAGSDCLGLIRGLWRFQFGTEPENIRPYTPDWSEIDGVERLLAGALRHLNRADGPPLLGDILLFRMKAHSVAKHLGIVSDTDPVFPKFIHAYSRHGVIENPLTLPWSRRITGVFRFPDRSP